jgi:ElaB/YqjD/DUF883 family membrane-anchored ribosome-binding protein
MQAATEKLMDDLRAVVGDAEELLKVTANQTGERVEKIRARAEESVRKARVRLLAGAHDVDEAARAAAREVDSQVRENPWAAAGIAAGVGLVLGFLLGRK